MVRHQTEDEIWEIIDWIRLLHRERDTHNADPDLISNSLTLPGATQLIRTTAA
jgi:hypothetical protein